MMIDQPRILLGYYEAISHVSQVMLQAATRDDWKAFEHAQSCCEELVRCLQETGITLDSLDEGGRRRRMEIMRQLLSDDARIRNLAQPSFQRLDVLLAGRRLSEFEKRAY